MSLSVTVPSIRGRKGGDKPLVMLTAYDAPSARVAADAGVEMILVGDSVAMVVLGYDDTLHVEVGDMVHHTAAVHRGLRDRSHQPLVVADLPWMSYHTGPADAVVNAAQLIRAGATAVKLEGGRKRVPVIEALVDAEIPVVGHIGLTPQSVHGMGGFKVQGRGLDAARDLVADARAVADAGAFAVVLEGVPAELAGVITEAVAIPTIGIGAGPACDGQVLVFHDVLGLEDRLAPRFVRRYAALAADATAAVRAWAADVRCGAFPDHDESYHLAADVAAALGAHAPMIDADPSSDPGLASAIPGAPIPTAVGTVAAIG
jgi:3-methyl-2-oxobutanoate hydroxymethyltransferase